MPFDIVVEPSCDLHLTLSTSGAKEVQLEVKGRSFPPGDRKEHARVHGVDFILDSLTDQCSFAIHQSGANPLITVNAHPDPARTDLRVIRATGQGTGESFIVANHTDSTRDPPVDTYIVVKVTVHDRLDGWWFGAESMIVPKDNRLAYSQVSLYALFDSNASHQGVIEDITGHGFITLTPDPDPNPNFQVEAYGRLKGISTGQSTLQGTLSSPPFTDPLPVSPPISTIPVHVKTYYGDLSDPADQSSERHNPILKRQSNGTVPHRSVHRNNNLLFVGEGFGSEQDFNRAVTEIKDRLFSSRRHSPFLWLKDNFNLWKLWQDTPTHANGITDTRRRSPSAMNGTGLAAMGSMEGLFQVVSSHLGICYRSRKGDRRSQRVSASRPLPADFAAAQSEWSRLTLHHENDVIGDPRRYPPEVDWEKALMRYFTALADPRISDTTSPEYHVGKVWRKSIPGFSKDFRFVGIVVNDHYFRAWNDPWGFFLLGITAPQDACNRRLPNVTVEHISDKIWRLQRSADAVAEYDFLTDVFAHEWGHSFNLGDEYEETEGVMPLISVSTHDSTHHLKELTTATSAPPDDQVPVIVYDRVKWGQLHRIRKSDVIIEDAEIDTTQSRITVRLTNENAKAWRVRRWTLNMAADNPAYVRLFIGDGQRQLPTDHNDTDRLIVLENLTVVDNGVDLTAKTVTLSIPSIPTNLPKRGTPEKPYVPKGSVLYEPVRDCDSRPVFLIEELVKQHIVNTTHPLSTNRVPGNATDNCKMPTTTRQCGVLGITSRESPPDHPPQELLAAITSAGGTFPNNDFRIIGLYEGAARFTCGAFRPAGACKMRLQNIPDPPGQWQGDGESEFCYVCKYLIVNWIDASKHEIIEYQSYPGLFDYSICGSDDDG
jgi:hypothetical protein